MRHFIGFMVGFVLSALAGYAAPVVTPPIVEKATTADGGFAVPIDEGGTFSTDTPTAGAVCYGDGSAYRFSAAGTLGDCLKSGGSGAPTWGSCSSISAYSTIQDEGTPLTQRTTLNFAGPITCVDNAGSTRTDCTVNTPVIQTARLGATVSNATTTGVEVTGLQVTVPAAGTFLTQYKLIVQSTLATNGYKFGVNFTGTLTLIKCSAKHPTTGTTASSGTGAAVLTAIGGTLYENLGTANTASTTAPNLGPNTGVNTINANILVEIDCILVTSTAGDIELWHGSETAVATSVQANSVAIVTTIP